ncbi:MAG: hypothetical protein R3D58_16260 [Saprospiraceae bacterium]
MPGRSQLANIPAVCRNGCAGQRTLSGTHCPGTSLAPGGFDHRARRRARCYLPFEALITRAGAQAHRFGSHRYLLHAYRTGYAHSAMAWLTLATRHWPAASGLLAVAPRFAPNRWGLDALQNNGREANRAGHLGWHAAFGRVGQ